MGQECSCNMNCFEGNEISKNNITLKVPTEPKKNKDGSISVTQESVLNDERDGNKITPSRNKRGNETADYSNLRVLSNYTLKEYEDGIGVFNSNMSSRRREVTNNSIEGGMISTIHPNIRECKGTIIYINTWDEFKEHIRPNYITIEASLTDKSIEFDKIEVKLRKSMTHEVTKTSVNNTLTTLYKYCIKLFEDDSLCFGYFNSNWEMCGFGVKINSHYLYIGDFSLDLKEGTGLVVNANGDIYEGQLEKDVPCGEGRFYSSNGNIYSGSFQDGYQHGYGEELHSNGAQYLGFFLRDVKEGFGKLFYDGTIYIGDFVSNTLAGVGRIHYEDNRIYEGYIHDFKMEGIGCFTWPDNKKYIGNYRKDKRNGFGIMLNPIGIKYEGMWLDGALHGFALEYTSELMTMTEWRFGKLIRRIDLASDDPKRNQMNAQTVELLENKANETFETYKAICSKLAEVQSMLDYIKQRKLK